MMDAVTEMERNDVGSGGGQPKRSHQQSTVQFPYGDLDTAIDVASAIHANVGGGTCTQDQLVAYLGHKDASGTFRHKVSAAKIFGLIERAGAGEIRLTDLGLRIVDQAHERQAKAQAFLSVELYRRLFEEFKGRTLPPRPAPLERTFVDYGVAPKQKDKARQAFERSAQQAGFFEHGRERLVMPSGATFSDPPKEEVRTSGSGGDGNGGGTEGLDLDPLILGLLRRMPPPSEGWPPADMARWARALLMNLSFIYGHTASDASLDVVVQNNGNEPRRD